MFSLVCLFEVVHNSLLFYYLRYYVPLKAARTGWTHGYQARAAAAAVETLQKSPL